MAEDVYIPGDDLEEAKQNLTAVHDQIDLDHHTFDFDAAFGPELGRGSAQHFEDRWSDGRYQLKKQIEGVRDEISNILDTFDKTDQDAAQGLDGGQG
jgi:hypothetical protein